MNLKEQVFVEMRNPKGYSKVIKDVERDLKYNMGIPCEHNWTINFWKPEESFSGKDGKAQLTSFIGARLFDLWEDAVIKVIKNKLKPISKNIKVNHEHNQKGDMAIIFPDKSKEVWEIKSTQSDNDSFIGSTHSTGKEDLLTNYILINYNINRNKKMSLKENKGIINEVAILVGKIKLKRGGKGTTTNSRTSLKIPKKKAKELTAVIGTIITSGKRTKWAGIKRDKIIIKNGKYFYGKH